MTKADLVANIASQANLTKADSERALNAFLDNVAEALKSSGKLTLTGFGTFIVAERKARMGRNPQTGEPIKIKAGKTVRFRAGKGLKDAL
ncbi:MAG: HU family DNA-binding protein [Deltaproteobacteria bacterium]|nr:HU family DNA-binding protein [Deltaproteobacteria bacterium]